MTLRKELNKPINNDVEVESYRLQVRISKEDYERLQKLAVETCTAMSMWGSIFIHDGLERREREKNK